jgi:transposase
VAATRFCTPLPSFPEEFGYVWSLGTLSILSSSFPFPPIGQQGLAGRCLQSRSGRSAESLAPARLHMELLVTIPGIERLVAWQLIAELGVDMTIFPDADHCASWAGLGENESTGKHKSTRCRKGNKSLRRVLTQAAWAASHCKTGYLRAFFNRVKARRGWAKANRRPRP